MPHEALGKDEIESRWDTITQVYARFKAAECGEETESEGEESSLQVLKRRFAAGEISEEEFKRKKELLE